MLAKDFSFFIERLVVTIVVTTPIVVAVISHHGRQKGRTDARLKRAVASLSPQDATSGSAFFVVIL